MNKLSSFATFVTAALVGIATESAWSDEVTWNGSAKPDVQTPAPTTGAAPGWYPPPGQGESDKPAVQTPAPTTGVAPGWYPPPGQGGSDKPAVQTPAPTTGVAPGWYPPTGQGGYAQTWQQPPLWRAPQQVYGHLPPRYPARGQYQAFPAAPATAQAAWENPLSAELKQAQEELTATSSELDMARRMLEQVRSKLQESVAAEQALRVRVTELTETLNTSSATLEQQHQLINNHQAQNQNLTAERDQLHSKLASRDKQLAGLQSELQVATQALAHARVQIGTHRDGLTKLEAELERQGPSAGRSANPD